MTIRTRTILLAALLAPLAAAQVGQQSNVDFRAEFNIRDSGDAGAKTGRKYALVLHKQIKGQFKVGNRIPVATSNQPGSSQFTYVDVGVNIDCVVDEREGKIAMHTDMDMSTAVTSEKTPAANPTISQIRLNIDTTLTPGKPTVVASFDDPVTSRKFEVEATVTKM